jgi:hypothetical protein
MRNLIGMLFLVALLVGCAGDNPRTKFHTALYLDRTAFNKEDREAAQFQATNTFQMLTNQPQGVGASFLDGGSAFVGGGAASVGGTRTASSTGGSLGTGTGGVGAGTVSAGLGSVATGASINSGAAAPGAGIGGPTIGTGISTTSGTGVGSVPGVNGLGTTSGTGISPANAGLGTTVNGTSINSSVTTPPSLLSPANINSNSLTGLTNSSFGITNTFGPRP